MISTLLSPTLAAGVVIGCVVGWVYSFKDTIDGTDAKTARQPLSEKDAYTQAYLDEKVTHVEEFAQPKRFALKGGYVVGPTNMGPKYKVYLKSGRYFTTSRNYEPGQRLRDLDTAVLLGS